MLDSVGKQSNWIGDVCSNMQLYQKDAKAYQDLSKKARYFVHKESILELVRDRNKQVLIGLFCQILFCFVS